MSFLRLAAALFATALITASTGLCAATPGSAATAARQESPPALEAIAAVPRRPDEGAHELTTADLAAWLDGLLAYGLKNGDIAGAEISVVKDGRLLFESGYGYADVAKKIRMDPEKVMTRLGSTSKLFTWTAVMQLVEQGKLDLDRNVDDYLDFHVSPAGGRPITLQDLMNHRGGFEEGLKDIFALDPKDLMSTETYLKRHPPRLLFEAGTVPAYSNYGAALAGYIVQRISGEPFERYMENHILRPLGMSHTTFEQPLPERYQGMMAQGYRTASEPPQGFELVVTAPAGSGTTTAADMARFMLAHLAEGRAGDYPMLRTETAKQMHSPSESSLPGFDTMAHGFFHETRNGRTLIGHGGDTIFFHTELDLLPQEGVGIFYSFNSRGRDVSVYALRQALLDQFMDRYFPYQTVASETPTMISARTDAAKIAGRYETSRRIEHGFLSFFYLLQQTVISANPDGTINAPKTFAALPAQFQEIAPDVWREIGGKRQLAFRPVNGLGTVIDSEDPTSVFQAVPLRRSSAFNTTVLAISLLVLLSAVVLWPLLHGVRRHYQRAVRWAPGVRRHRVVLRSAAAFGLVWMLGWGIVLLPVLNLQLEFYTDRHDPVIRLMQIGGLLLVVLSAAALWSFGRLCRSEISWLARTGNGVIVAALLGLVWIGYAGGLLSLSLNY